MSITMDADRAVRQVNGYQALSLKAVAERRPETGLSRIVSTELTLFVVRSFGFRTGSIAQCRWNPETVHQLRLLPFDEPSYARRWQGESSEAV